MLQFHHRKLCSDILKSFRKMYFVMFIIVENIKILGIIWLHQLCNVCNHCFKYKSSSFVKLILSYPDRLPLHFSKKAWAVISSMEVNFECLMGWRFWCSTIWILHEITHQFVIRSSKSFELKSGSLFVYIITFAAV